MKADERDGIIRTEAAEKEKSYSLTSVFFPFTKRRQRRDYLGIKS